MGAWRYWTGSDCLRHWGWFPRVGPAETVRSIVGPCSRAALVGGGLIAGGSAPVVPTVPPDLWGRAYVDRGGYGGPGLCCGWGGAGGVDRGPYRHGLNEVGLSPFVPLSPGMTDVTPQTWVRLQPPTAVGESPTPYAPPVAEVPVSVPEPSSAAVMAVAVVAAVVLRGRA